MSSVTVGEIIPIKFDSGDGNVELFVRATVKTPSGSIWAVVNLLNENNGKYVNRSVVMPNEAYVFIEFIAYYDSSYLEEADYLQVTDTISLKNEGSGGGNLDDLLNEIKSITSDSFDILVEEEDEVVLDVEEDNEVVLAVETDDNIVEIEVFDSDNLVMDIESDGEIELETSD